MSVVKVACLGGFSTRRKYADPVAGLDVVGECFRWAVFPADVENCAGCRVGENALPGCVGGDPSGRIVKTLRSKRFR
jgi:hypothetical protein